MAKFIAGLLLIIMLMALATLTLVAGGDAVEYGNSFPKGEESPLTQATHSANATATFGAEQFHIQLTAIAEEGK